jgi:two-component system, NarL family, nitrate/nitrite response regulator NarL
MPLTVAVVEDDPFTRTMLVASLGAHGVEVVVETDTPAVALQLSAIHRPSVALLDLHLGEGPTGIDLAHALRAVDARIALVVLTSFDDPRLLSTQLPAPPLGTEYLRKRDVANIEVLLRAIKDAVEARPVSAGRSGIGRRPLARSRPTPGTSRGVVDLTDTQLDTLRLLAGGLSNAQIAARRSVTERTVETTIARAARALGLAADATRNQRVQMARAYLRATGVQHDDA